VEVQEVWCNGVGRRRRRRRKGGELKVKQGGVNVGLEEMEVLKVKVSAAVKEVVGGSRGDRG